MINNWCIITMLFYDYEKIYILSVGRSDLILHYLKKLKDEPDAHKMLLGNSFIINEDVVIRNTRHLTKQQLAEYLGILSIRSYSTYLLTEDSSLDMEMLYPWIPKTVVETNPLIAIKQTKLIFNEEIIYG